MSKTKLKIHELIRIIGKRLLLFSSSLNNFESYKLYLDGLFFGLKLFSKIKFEREISAWFQSHVEYEASNMNWFDQFKMYYADKNDDEKIEIFIDTIALLRSCWCSD